MAGRLLTEAVCSRTSTARHCFVSFNDIISLMERGYNDKLTTFSAKTLNDDPPLCAMSRAKWGCAGPIKQSEQQEVLKDEYWRFTSSRSDQTRNPKRPVISECLLRVGSGGSKLSVHRDRCKKF